MNKLGRFLLFIALVLILVGGGLFVYGYVKGDFEIVQATYLENTYEVEDSFSNIDIDVNISDVKFVYDNTLEKCKVLAKEYENTKHKTEVKDNTLSISFVDERQFFKKWFFNFRGIEITVYLNKNTFDKLVLVNNTGDVDIPSDFTFTNATIGLDTGDVNFYASVTDVLKIETDTGDIKAENSNLKAMTVATDTGRLTLKNFNATEDISIKSSTGKINLENVVAGGLLNIKASTGDISLSNVDGNQIKIKTSTGDVKGNVKTAKTFDCDSDTGKVRVPSTSGNLCKIETDTGDIIITVNE